MLRLHRIPVETLCTEIAGEREQLSLVVDLSETGLRLQRPLRGRQDSSLVQVEFELPGEDEIVWAKGEVCFDQLWRGERGPLRTSGIRIVDAATRHLRMLRDWVVATREARHLEEQPWWALAHATHWSG
jgi:hypothetical protein